MELNVGALVVPAAPGTGRTRPGPSWPAPVSAWAASLPPRKYRLEAGLVRHPAVVHRQQLVGAPADRHRASVQLQLDRLDRGGTAAERPDQLGRHLRQLLRAGRDRLSAQVDRGVLAVDAYLADRLRVRGEARHRGARQPADRILQQRVDQPRGQRGVGGLRRHEHRVGHQCPGRPGGDEVEVARLIDALEVGLGQQQLRVGRQRVDPPLTVGVLDEVVVVGLGRPGRDQVLAVAGERRDGQPGDLDLGPGLRLVG